MFSLFSAASPVAGVCLGIASSGQGPPRGTNRNLRTRSTTCFQLMCFRISFERTFGRRSMRSNTVPLMMSMRGANPQVQQGIHVRPAHQARNRALVRDRNRDPVGRIVRGNARAVPQCESEFELQALVRMGKKSLQAVETLFGGVMRILRTVEIGARRRQARRPAPAFRGKRLINTRGVAIVGDCAATKIDQPQPRRDFPDLADGGFAVGVEPVVPDV